MDYTEKKRAIPVCEDYELVIAGAGPSGIAAALIAGRCGIKTLIIESLGTVGGMSTSGLMSHWTGSVGSPLYDELQKRAADMNVFSCSVVRREIDPELLKILYCDMLREAGVDILLYTFVCGAITDKGKVTGVICENKGGRRAYTAKAVIDCTGDGDVGYYAGAEYRLGREPDGKMQPATLMFKIGGVDYDRAVFPGYFECKVDTDKGELQSLGQAHLPGDAGHVLLYRSTLPGIVTCNMTNASGIDGTKAEDLTRADLTCRWQLLPIVDFLREFAPGYEKCYLISSASMIGIRETRHFKGLYCITEDDILAARVFDDMVVRDAHFNFDIHNLNGAGLDEHGCQAEFKQNSGYTIPYRCLVPEKTDGLLLSGRNISGTHVAHSNFRAMPICFGIGAACGGAAVEAIRGGIELRKVDAARVRDIIENMQ